MMEKTDLKTIKFTSIKLRFQAHFYNLLRKNE